MITEFLGKQLSGPFNISSGTVATAPAVFQRVMDTMPEIGVITTKSIGFEPRLGNREPVYSQFATGVQAPAPDRLLSTLPSDRARADKRHVAG